MSHEQNHSHVRVDLMSFKIQINPKLDQPQISHFIHVQMVLVCWLIVLVPLLSDEASATNQRLCGGRLHQLGWQTVVRFPKVSKKGKH